MVKLLWYFLWREYLVQKKKPHTQFTWTAGKGIISFLLRNKTHSWRASYNRESPMDLTWNVSEHAVLHVLLLSSFPFPLRGLLFALTFFSHRLCSLVMQFSALHDSHRATRSFFFFFFSYSTPGKKKDKVCSTVIHLLPVSEDCAQSWYEPFTASFFLLFIHKGLTMGRMINKTNKEMLLPWLVTGFVNVLPQLLFYILNVCGAKMKLGIHRYLPCCFRNRGKKKISTTS